MNDIHKFNSGDALFILDHLNTAVFRTSLDKHGKFIDVNPAFLKIFGYKEISEIKSVVVSDLYANPLDRELISRELSERGELQNKEIAFKRKDGSSFMGRVSSVLVNDSQNKPLYIDGVVDDMTEQQLQIKALNAAEKNLRMRQIELLEERKIFFSGPVIQIQWPINEQDALNYVSDNVFDILGYKPEELTSGQIHYPNLVHKDDLAELQLHIKKILKEGGEVISVQPYRLLTKAGQYIWVQDYGYVQKDDTGKPSAIMGYIYDVTELEESHQKILESETRYKDLVENSPTGILRIDLGGNILDVNQRMVDILGSPSKEMTKSFNMLTFQPLKDAGISQKFEEVIETDGSVQFTSEYTTAWKKKVYFQVVVSPVHDAHGRVIGAQGNMEDVTLQYLAEREKRELEQTQIEERNMFMEGPIIVLKWDISADKPLLSVSENIINILGYSVDEMLGGKVVFGDIIHPDDLDEVRTTARNAIESGIEAFDTMPYRVRTKSGAYIWMNDHSTIIRDEQGEVKNISGILYDISWMIEAKTEIEQKEQNYQALFNSITEAVFIQDPRTYEIIEVNETMLSMYGYERPEVLGTSIQKYSYDDDIHAAIDKIIESAKSDGQQTFEWLAKHKDGSKFWVEVKLHIAVINGEERILANARDISNRKNILVKLKQSLKEQDLLLREVHHRVKNNMQVIISLLNLQAEHTQNEDLFEIFGETQNRIRTMALIHDKLFRSNSMSSVDFKEYVNSLLIELNNFYKIDTRRIKFHQDLETMDLDITKAIPCGLIINELITNALKYAFPNNRDGEIRLSVRSVGESRAELIVGDNGVGMDKKIDLKTTKTMGLRIVRILTEQLQADMRVDHEGGTKFTLEFELGDED